MVQGSMQGVNSPRAFSGLGDGQAGCCCAGRAGAEITQRDVARWQAGCCRGQPAAPSLQLVEFSTLLFMKLIRTAGKKYSRS